MSGAGEASETSEEARDEDLALIKDYHRLIGEEDGVGVIEVVLILVVLIGLVAIFKDQINALLNRIFGSISSLSNDIL